MYRSKAWLAGLLAAGLLAGVAGTALGHDPQAQSGMHYGYGMGQGMMAGPGMGHDGGMRPGAGMREGSGMHHGPGYGQGTAYGMHHGQGMHHQMHPGMHPRMHPGMQPRMQPGCGMRMGPGAGMGTGMGRGAGMGPGMIYGWPADGRGQEISVEDARGWLERKLAWHGNPRLKLGEVREIDDGKLLAEIVTRDGSLVQKLAIDRRSGALRQLDD